MKKVLSIVLAIVMIATMSVVAFAETQNLTKKDMVAIITIARTIDNTFFIF